MTQSPNVSLILMLCICRAQETLLRHLMPKFHIFRSHYQASIWNQTHLQHPDLPPVTGMGGMNLEGQLMPRLLSLPPIPNACKAITCCGCTRGCINQLCRCRKNRMDCIEACYYRKLGVSCLNIRGDQN